MSTRNNNFSNRSQKGVLIVNPVLWGWQIALIVIGCFAFVSIVSVGGVFLYAHKFPHSRVAAKVQVVKDAFTNLKRRITHRE